MVGAGTHLAPLPAEGVVGLAAPHGGEAEARAEAHRLHGGDGEEVLGEDALHIAAVVGGPQAGGEALHRAADTAPHAVLVRLGTQDGLLKLLRRGVGDARHVGDAGGDGHAHLPQNQLGDRPGKDQGGGEAAGEVPAAPVVAAALGVDIAGVVCVAGPGEVLQLGVVLRAGVGVLNHRAEGRAGGLPLKHAGENPGLVGLPPGGGEGVPARSAAGELAADEVHVQFHPGGDILQHHTDGASVGLAENDMFHTGHFLCGGT